MKYIIVILLSLFLFNFSNAENLKKENISLEEILSGENIVIAGTCFYSGEQISGMNKICYYNCISGTVAITVRSTQLCPLNINR